MKDYKNGGINTISFLVINDVHIGFSDPWRDSAIRTTSISAC